MAVSAPIFHGKYFYVGEISSVPRDPTVFVPTQDNEYRECEIVKRKNS